MCTKFKRENINDPALVIVPADEMMECEAHLGMTLEGMLNAIDAAIDCSSMPMEGGCDTMTSWSLPK